MSKNTTFLLIYQKVWVSKRWLIENGVPYKTILNGTKRFSDGKSNQWGIVKNPNSSDESLINYCSIPDSTLEKNNLPSHEVAKKMAIELTKVVPNTKDQLRLSVILCRLEVAALSKWGNKVIYYEGLMLRPNVVKSMAVNHAVFEELLFMIEEKEKITTLFYVYKSLQFRCNFFFKTPSEQYFRKKINKAKNETIELSLTHGLFNTIGNNTKVDRFWELKTNELFRNGKLPVNQVVSEINRLRDLRGLVEISYSTIFRLLKNPENLNKNLLIRYGENKYRQSHLTYQSLHTKGVNEVWEIDGTRLPFLVQNKSKLKIGVLQFVIVIDVFSKKIIGFSIGEKENNIMIKEALYRAIVSTRRLPKMLVHDGAKAFKAKALDQLKYTTGIQGVVWRKHPPYKPQEKGTIERINGTLNTSVFSHFYGYLGEGIKSKREYAHPSKEELLEFRKKGNPRTKYDLLKLFIQSISIYNSKSFDKKPVPTEVYNSTINDSKKEKGYRIKPELIALGFFSSTTITIKRSMVQFDFRRKKNRYSLPENKRLELNGTRVLVSFNPEDLSKIFLFNTKTENFICELDLDISISRIPSERSEKESKQSKLRGKMNSEYIKNVYNKIKEENTELEGMETDQSTLSFLIPGIDDKTILKEAELSLLLNASGIDNIDEVGLQNESNKPLKHFSLVKSKGKTKIK